MLGVELSEVYDLGALKLDREGIVINRRCCCRDLSSSLTRICPHFEEKKATISLIGKKLIVKVSIDYKPNWRERERERERE